MLMLLAALVAAPAPDLPSWSIVSVDRQSLIAVDTKPLKLGISGGQTAVVTVIADPEPGKPTVAIMKFENDCWAGKQRISGGLKEVVGSSTEQVVEVSEWQEPTKGSLMDALLHQSCDKEAMAHKDWLPTPLTTTQLVDFYFTKVLGRLNPFNP